MVKNTYFFLFVSLWTVFISCKSQDTPPNHVISTQTADTTGIKPGANRTELYLPLLPGKRVGIVTNQTGVIVRHPDSPESYLHIVDSLKNLGVDIRRIFSPEHGFRGTADAGEQVRNGIDIKTGLPIISLYGVQKKPAPEYLEDLDVLIFDIQDTGVRFYTYISTLHYIMEAAAQQNIPVIVLDRPNPNAQYIDGPVLKDELRSFVGMHPVPIVYGMTIGEYAQMINGEKWLQGGISCKLTVIPIANYRHDLHYSLPVKPSPNLPNDQAVALYPSLCLFEGTPISCGRGTDMPFQIFGAPELPISEYPFSFIPIPNEGASHPKFTGETCHGLDLRQEEASRQGINLQWLLDAYKYYPDKKRFFNAYFDKLSGDRELKEQIKLGYSEEDIKKTWQPGLEKFKTIRAKYLLYP